MGFVSTQDKSVSEAAGAGFAEFASLSSHHKDGWGIATCGENEHPELFVEPTTASTSKTFETATHNLRTTGALLHLRLATANLAVTEGNTHPFTYGDYSFIHNGALKPPDPIIPFIDPKFLSMRRGETDSESFFYLIITEIEKYGVERGITSAVEIIRRNTNYSSINSMFLTPSEFYIVNEHNDEQIPQGEPPGYYDLFYRADTTEILVASNGWSQDGWTELPNHTLMKVNRKTLQTEISDLNG